MRNIIIILLIILMFHSCTGDNGDSGVFDNTPLRNVDMKPFAVPIQQKLTKSDRKKVFTKSFGGATSTIRPLYRYKIYARVYSTKRYPLGVDATPAPYDFALGWDGLEKEEVFNTIKARQSFRWVHWKLKPDCPYTVDGVYLRLANNHLIPANDNILKGLSKVKKKDIVYMEGYLVKFDTVKGSRTASGVSSTTRDDRKNHSCEIMYVTRLVTKHGDYR